MLILLGEKTSTICLNSLFCIIYPRNSNCVVIDFCGWKDMVATQYYTNEETGSTWLKDLGRGHLPIKIMEDRHW